MDKAQVIRDYEAKRSLYERLRAEALFTIEETLAPLGVKLHSVTSRLKTAESFAKKIERGRYQSPFEDIHDIVGVRIVCLFLSDIARIRDAIAGAFDVSVEDDKIEGADVASFGYMSLHLVVTFKKSYSGPRYDSLRELAIEVQVRTLAMDAWANVSHHLSYKADVDVPQELKRDFHALSGLFYVADKHFELFYRASIASRRSAYALVESRLGTKSREPLNVDTLSAYLRKAYPERDTTDSQGISELLHELLGNGVVTLADLDQLLARTADALTTYERQSSDKGSYLSDVGAVRTALYISDGKAFEKEHPGEADWAEQFATLRDLLQPRGSGPG
jgi:ppGpp synthetase/RelA/SpoT-type nucleotidyltranferase